MEGLHQKYADIKRTDVARNSFIEELLQKITDLNKMMDRSSFVLVLIDGDCMNFRDDLILKGIEGGDEAAKRLRNAIFEELRYEKDFKHDDKIVIKVYANLRGLSKAYADHNILPNIESFSQFVLGFNKAHPLCDFIDAGNHKEAADKKLQENLNLYIHNVHCTHIVFGGSGDNGYASFLNQFESVDVPTRVRLLKGPPFPFEFNNILHKFKQVVFEDVFRTRMIGTAPKRRHIQQDDHRERRPEDVAFKTGAVLATLSPTLQQLSAKNEEKGLVVSNQQRQASMTTPSQDHAQHKSDNGPSHQLGNGSAAKDTVAMNPGTSSHSIAEIEVILIMAANERLIQSPKALDFGIVKQRAAQLLSLPLNYWTEIADDRFNDRSKDVIKWAVEEWIERTNNPPPKNATWLLRYFPAGVSPSTVMKDQSSLQWRTRGNPEWTGHIAGLISQMQDAINLKQNLEG